MQRNLIMRGVWAANLIKTHGRKIVCCLTCSEWKWTFGRNIYPWPGNQDLLVIIFNQLFQNKIIGCDIIVNSPSVFYSFDCNLNCIPIMMNYAFVFYAFVFYALHNVHCNLWIAFNGYFSSHCILYIVFQIIFQIFYCMHLFSMHFSPIYLFAMNLFPFHVFLMHWYSLNFYSKHFHFYACVPFCTHLYFVHLYTTHLYAMHLYSMHLYYMHLYSKHLYSIHL